MWIGTKLQAVVRSVVIAVIASLALVASAQNADPVAFIYPAQDKDLGPDDDLRDYLQKNTTSHIRFEDGRRFNYQDVIADVLKYSKDGTRYVARLTPYAYVAAELQGADFEVLATYVSKATGTVTYHSYLVVRAETEGDPYKFSKEPTQRDVIEYLEKPKLVRSAPSSPRPPRTFVYHDKFSTSSYFVPSVFFRANRIFNTAPGAGGTLNPITVVERTDKKSSELIKMVANSEPAAPGKPRADIAAVWDGTKKSFESEYPELAKKLRFIEIPTVLPNDLLVCSKNLPLAQKDELRKAIQDLKGCLNGKPAFGGADSDFACWMDINEAVDATKALVGLRREAIAPPAPVTVRVGLSAPSAADVTTKKRHESYLQAARQAIRFAGTEFMLHEEGFHEQTPDIDWKIEPVHDGAILLHVTMNRVEKVATQHIPVSFTDAHEDLPRRIETIMHTRLNRIRYIWPYSTSEPLILRDVSFSLDPKTPLRAQYITWTHPEKNMFVRSGKDYELKLAEGQSDSYKFVLDAWPPETANEKRPDPMSNAAYRVVLVRPTVARPLFRNLTLALVFLLVAAALAVIYDWLRVRRARTRALALTASPELRPVE